MKTKLTSIQKSSLTSAIIGASKSNYLCKRYILTRRNYICKLLLRSVALDQPLIYVYNSLGSKTRIQMLRIIAYILDYRSDSEFNPSFFKELFGSDIVDTFDYMLDKHSNTYI